MYINGRELLKLLTTYVFFKIYYFLSVQGFSVRDATLLDSCKILRFKSGILAEFSYDRFSRKSIDIQPNDVCCDLFAIKTLINFEIWAKLIFQLLPPNV